MKCYFVYLILFLLSFGRFHSQTPIKQLSRGDLEFSLYTNGFKIKNLSNGVDLIETVAQGTDHPFGFASYPNSTVDYEDYFFLIVKDSTQAGQWWTNSLVTWSSDDPNYLIDASFKNNSNNEVMSLHVELLLNNKIYVKVLKNTTVSQPWKYRSKLRLKLYPDEYFLGFGERLEGVAFRGKTMLNWISEGRVSNEPQPKPENQGNYRVPFYLSTRGYGLLIHENSCSSFDLGESDPNINEIAVWDQQLSFTIYAGTDPKQIIQNYTEESGRILRTPEPWVFGVWVMAKNRNFFLNETDRSMQVANTLRNDSIPCSAIWHHYWSEKINNILGTGMKWDLNVAKYPNYSNLITSHHNDGFKVLHYYWPYIFNNDYDYATGNSNGFFMKTWLNTTYLNQWFSFWAQVAEPDFTKATSRKWFGDSILYNAYNRGSSGWMADFGEHHRIDMIDSANANPYAVHNEYPLTWGRTNQEFWEERQPDGDYTFWMRGGWTGIQKFAPLMWNGDTQFDWSEGDGIKSIIPSILTAGISGHPFVSAHIAGYGYTDRLGNTILPSNSEELWIRWVQTCSMFPVMWTHEGDELSSIPKPVFDQSALTKSQFKKYAKLHIKFFPYFYTLAKDGKDKGLPVARSLYLHYPNDANCISIKDQFLLGDRVMVAPVLDSGAVGRSVYFPQGDWYDYWTGNFTASGPTTLSVSAPLDHLPIYVKEGSILPQFNQDHIETLMKNVAGVNDFGFANSSMEFRFYGCGSDQLQLWDGTTVEMQYFTGDSLTNISGGPSRTYTSTFIHEPSVNCFAGIEEQQTGESIRIYPNPTTGIATIVLDELYNSSGTIEIYNTTGLLLQQEKFQMAIGESTKPLNVSNLANGIYHLVVRGNEGVRTIRLLKY